MRRSDGTGRACPASRRRRRQSVAWRKRSQRGLNPTTPASSGCARRAWLGSRFAGELDSVETPHGGVGLQRLSPCQTGFRGRKNAQGKRHSPRAWLQIANNGRLRCGYHSKTYAPVFAAAGDAVSLGFFDGMVQLCRTMADRDRRPQR
jgi:hypothetical protein